MFGPQGPKHFKGKTGEVEGSSRYGHLICRHKLIRGWNFNWIEYTPSPLTRSLTRILLKRDNENISSEGWRFFFIFSKLANKKFSSAARRLQSPLLDSVADTSILIEPGHANMNHLSKIGNENRWVINYQCKIKNFIQYFFSYC